MVPVLFGLSVLLFIFVHLLPGDPAIAILGERARPDLIAALRANLGLDRPLYAQYLQYFGQLLRGDLGHSIVNDRPVLLEFGNRLPATIELSLAALVIAIGVGVPLGRLAAFRQRTWVDGAATTLSVMGVSVPVFVSGLALQYIFAVQLGWLPSSGRLDPRINIDPITNFMLVDTLLEGRLDALRDAMLHLVLPAIALGSISLAIISRITRASILAVAQEQYVRTAEAKGLSERQVRSAHIMRNAWLALSTVLGIQVGYLLAGATLTETVFAWPGVGRWVVDAIAARDYIVVQSSLLVFALLFLLVNLAVDVSYAYLDPRIRYN
jgi:peptide/nickel transport system permease protein